MSKRIRMSMQTRNNWLIDAAVLVGGVLAALSGIYFLFLPSGGYQGGRNPMYGITILFSRQTWDDVHTWTGVWMIAAVVVHFAIHWKWVTMMSRRIANALLSRGTKLSRGGRFNLAIDAIVAISFLICAVSGIYFLLVPSGGLHGSSNSGWDPSFLFSRTTWDLIHTWSGTVLIAAVVVHFAIHWRWVKNVTARFFRSLLPQPEIERVPMAG
jgi:preprotein translocase subunit SecY